MNWGQWICTNQACTAEAWMVRRDSVLSDAWEVAAHVDDRPFLVAATQPLCPRCGTTLCQSVRLEQRIDDNTIEVGQVYEFVRSVPG